MNVNYDERKLTELLLCVAERLRSDAAGGVTKINRVLYFDPDYWCLPGEATDM
jgi:hypothetical protein